MTFHKFIWILSILLMFIIIMTVSTDDYSDLPKGPYCQRRGCCTGRQDECSVPILGTLCYCDDFCNKTRVEDCCPDFWSHCLGIEPPIEIPQPLTACEYNGRAYGYGKTIKKNCNTCKCDKIGDKLEMLCENDECLIEPQMVDSINNLRQTYGWIGANYSEFWGRKLDEGVRLRLGTFQPERLARMMYPISKFYDPHALPKQFDAENKWPGWISDIQEQGWCGSSWAISTAAVASDRFAIFSKGSENVRLSPQNFLSCDLRHQQGCNGGHLEQAWNYLKNVGLVDEDCLPYTGQKEKCPIPRRSNLLTAGCKIPKTTKRTSKYHTGAVYKLNNETDIMYEIQTSGPVQATMLVYHDFFAYQGGIYKHTDLSLSQRTGYHSVRIVGWGEEYTFNGIRKYWKVANSWGRQWGEDGYFRIVRGANECEIESFVLGVWPHVDNNLLIRNEIDKY